VQKRGDDNVRVEDEAHAQSRYQQIVARMCVSHGL
jgi:hypothetical protein